MNSDSPCIGNCTIDRRRICIGCRRTLSEIARWSTASHDEKRQILAAVEQRRANAAVKTDDPPGSDSINRAV